MLKSMYPDTTEHFYFTPAQTLTILSLYVKLFVTFEFPKTIENTWTTETAGLKTITLKI